MVDEEREINSIDKVQVGVEWEIEIADDATAEVCNYGRGDHGVEPTRCRMEAKPNEEVEGSRGIESIIKAQGRSQARDRTDEFGVALEDQ